MTSPITPTIGWQPIETAMPDEPVLLGWWFSHPEMGTWWECSVDVPHDGPTHWMPLPEPPALVRQEK